MKPRDQLDLLDDAEERKQAAIHRAEGAAERASPGWAVRAFECLRTYAETHPTLMSEDVREWAHCHAHLPMPPDHRAWGGVFQRAERAGIVKHLSFAAARSAGCHKRPSNVWRSEVYDVERLIEIRIKERAAAPKQLDAQPEAG